MSAPATAPARPPAPAPAPAPPVDERQSLLVAIARYARGLDRLRRGNAVVPLRGGGETFPAMLAAIAAAQRTVVFETYIIEPDETGERFADALIERAQAGVAVRFLYDGVGGFNLPDTYVERLRAGGVKVREFHPVAPWRERFGWAHRDHRKIVVVDDEIGFTGGLNISNDYAAEEQGGSGWHDVHVSVRGPAARDLARLFRVTWLRAGGDDYPAPPDAAAPDAPKAGTVAVRVLDNGKRRRRGTIRRAYLRAIEAARHTVHLENAYFLPDAGMRRAMRRAVRRGCDVAVIIPGRNDVRLVEYAGMYLHRWLAAAGIRILRWNGPMMHAKTAVIDGVWSTIGSYNFDARSWHYNLELTVEIIDADVGGQMERAWQEDAVHTTAFDVARWSSLPWWKRALAWLAFRLRDVL